MPKISVITCVLAGKHEYIGEAYSSLEKQVLPEGWEWEWIVQEDGQTGIPLAELPSDSRIKPDSAKHGYAARARNFALGRASGVLLRTLDADDILPEGSLARDILALKENPEISWCVSPALDLLEDGTLKKGPRDPEPGVLPSGFLAAGETAGMLQVIGTTMCSYTELISALGGWPALPSEDVALMLAVEAASTGMMLKDVGLHYRRWPGSTTIGWDKEKASPGTGGRTTTIQRVKNLQAAGWRWTPDASQLS